MDPLIDLNACSLLCLGKLSHSPRETHCNSPPQAFGITFITAVSSYSSFLFCWKKKKKLGHTNLQPALHSLKPVCKGERGEREQPGCSGAAEAVAVPRLPSLPCRTRGSPHLSHPPPAQKAPALSLPRSCGWAGVGEPGRISQMIQKSEGKDYGFTYIINAYAFIPSN